MSYKERLSENSRILEGTGTALYSAFLLHDGVNVLNIHVDVANYSEHLGFLTTYLKRAARLFGVLDDEALTRLNGIDLSIRPRQELLDGLDINQKKELEDLIKGYRGAHNDLSLLTRLSRPVYRKFDGNDVLLLQLGCLLGIQERTPSQVSLHQAIRRQFLLTDLVIDYAQCMHGGTSYSPADFLEAVAEEGNLGKVANTRFEDIDVVYRFRDEFHQKDAPQPSIKKKKSFSMHESNLLNSVQGLVAKVAGNPEAYVVSRL